MIKKISIISVCLAAVFLIAACEDSVVCKDASGNTRTWSTVNCPAYKCKGTDLICCDGAICGDICYNDMSKLTSTQGCVLPDKVIPECPITQIYDYVSKECKNISTSSTELGCSISSYNKCFLDCLHNENRECDKSTCACSAYFCQTKLDCPASCANAECAIAPDGKSKCICS